MAEQMVQASIHFKFDPAKGTVGMVEFPEEVTITLAVGDEVTAAKGAFDIDFKEAISAAALQWVETKMNEATMEATKQAKPAKKAATDKKAPAKKKAAGKKGDTADDMQLFD